MATRKCHKASSLRINLLRHSAQCKYYTLFAILTPKHTSFVEICTILHFKKNPVCIFHCKLQLPIQISQIRTFYDATKRIKKLEK